MDKQTLEYITKRMEEGNRRSDDLDGTEMRRRRRPDGTFMRGTDGEIQYANQNEPNVDRRRMEMHKGPDDENRRRIGFGQAGEVKSHWSEEEFVGDMEESLYHEVDDIFHYLEVMEKVHKKGYNDLAGAFYEIANEKYICAEFLKHQLKKTGHYNPSEHRELEKDLEHVRKMFNKI